MRAEIVFSDRQFRRMTTWCRLGADLFDRTPEYGSHPRIGHLDERFRHSVFLTQVPNTPNARIANRIHSFISYMRSGWV